MFKERTEVRAHIRLWTRNNPGQFASESGVVSIRVVEEYRLRVMTLPVILVPAKITDGVKVEGEEVQLGSYIYLMEDVTILSPGLLCFAVETQMSVWDTNTPSFAYNSMLGDRLCPMRLRLHTTPYRRDRSYRDRSPNGCQKWLGSGVRTLTAGKV